MTGTNRGKDWSAIDITDLQSCARLGVPLEGVAVLLSRDQIEVAKKALELRLSLPLAETSPSTAERYSRIHKQPLVATFR